MLNAKSQENKCICHFLVYVIRDGIFASSCRKCEEARIKHSKGISMLEISPNIAILLLIILLIFLFFSLSFIFLIFKKNFFLFLDFT